MVLLCFPNPKIGILVRKKFIHFNLKTYSIRLDINQPIIKDIKIDNKSSHITIRIQSPTQLKNKNHSSITRIIIKRINF
jgi:uncharacterized ubiquitin-like protein YukD